MIPSMLCVLLEYIAYHSKIYLIFQTSVELGSNQMVNEKIKASIYARKDNI